MILDRNGFGNDSYVKLLIQSNTTNGSTTFTDISGAGNTITGYGSIAHSTSQKKNGASSIYFDGSDDYLSVPDSDNWHFGGGDFTVDMFVYLDENSIPITYRFMIGYGRGSSSWGDNGHAWLLGLLQNSQMFFQAKSSATNDIIYQLGYPTVNIFKQWAHIAVVRHGSILKLYLNGINILTLTDIGQLYLPSGVVTPKLIIGDTSAFDGKWKGYMDQIRISKGTARWTRNFTPPNRMY